MDKKELLEIIKKAAETRQRELDLSKKGIKELPPEIGQLTNLTELDLGGNQLSSLPPEIGQLRNLTQLSLFNNRLINLPSEIGQLRNLIQFSLFNNQMINLPSEIGQLRNPTTLDLRSNQISSLPPEIGQLTNLTELFLIHNRLTSLPPQIGELTNLTTLDLSYNQLTSLPPEIGQMTNLVTLDLSHNKLSSLPMEIGQMTNLARLSLSDNQLSSLPPEIGQLKNLTDIDLSDNQLTSLPPQIGQLTNLTTLVLSNNQLRSLPSEIGQLRNLTELDLGGNQLTNLPMEIWQLTNLTRLYLSNNQLTSLPPEIGQIKNLMRCSLFENQLSSLPPEILDLNMEIKWEYEQFEEGIFLANNPWERPPVETIKRGKKAIWVWFEALEKEGEKRLNEVKVLLVGYGGAGKTSLVRKLTTGKFKKDEPKTHGVRIKDWKIKADPSTSLRTGGEDITIHFWDYGGQGIMQATHRVFFSHRSLYILVIDARQESDPQEWLKNIESIGGNSPVMVVINKIDEHPFGLNETELLRKYPNIKGFYHISCKNGSNIESFREDLIKQVGQVETRSIVWPRRWATVKERLGKLGKDYISYKDYEDICEEEGVKSESAQKELLGILHELGVMLHFPDWSLPDMEVLNPEWATEGIYKIVNSAELKTYKGMLPGDRLDYVLNKERLDDDGGKQKKYSRDEQRYIVTLMNKFELCYELKDGTLFVPDLLTEQESPEGLPEKPDVRFYFEYDFMPAVVMPRFMVQKQADLDVKLCWRTGAVLKNKTFGSVAVVRQDKNRRRINIDITGKDAKGYLSSIRDIITGINESFAKLPCEEWVPLPDEPEYAVKYKDLTGHQDSKRDEKFVGELKKGYSVAKLLSGIEDPLGREFGRFCLYPPFFEILPGEDSFADAWEVFCCDVLNRYEKTDRIIRRKAPEGGVDLLWTEMKRAYQCKSVLDPTTTRFDVGKAVESVKAALARRKETGWETFYICSNVDITGPQEKKLREACPGVDLKLLTPSFWLPRCREQSDQLRGRFSELRRPHGRC
jgi:hypothetical protein